MKKIIVPVDFSEQSEQALKVAASLAKQYNSEILALHMLDLNPVIVTPVTKNTSTEELFFYIKLAEKKFHDFLKKPYLKDIKITPIIKHFKVFSEINEVANEHNADLIIMGSHGSDGVNEFFIGSNTEKVVRHSDIPVMVIKNIIDNFKIDSFVFACDFKEESLIAFQKAKKFSDKLSAELNLVYINVPGDLFITTKDLNLRILNFLKIAQINQKVAIYNDLSVEKGILNYSKSINANIIGIPTHGRKGLSHFFKGSIGEDIANHSNLPVITFKI